MRITSKFKLIATVFIVKYIFSIKFKISREKKLKTLRWQVSRIPNFIGKSRKAATNVLKLKKNMGIESLLKHHLTCKPRKKWNIEGSLQFKIEFSADCSKGRCKHKFKKRSTPNKKNSIQLIGKKFNKSLHKHNRLEFSEKHIGRLLDKWKTVI